jgi:hypothetical protein
MIALPSRPPIFLLLGDGNEDAWVLGFAWVNMCRQLDIAFKTNQVANLQRFTFLMRWSGRFATLEFDITFDG